MRVLGIDPGLSRCGVGVIDQATTGRPRAVRAAVVRTPPGDATELRLLVLHDALTRLVADVRPDSLALEAVFVGANTRTVIGVAQAAGVALLVAARAGLPVVQYGPSQVKAAVTGSGQADKDQVGMMVAAQLGLDSAPAPADAADALAVALCHLARSRYPAADTAAAPSGVVGAARMHPRLAAAVAAAGPGAQIAAPDTRGRS